MAGVCGIYEALWLAQLHRASAGALYVHVPFCARKCAYCDFASSATRNDDPIMAVYLARIRQLLDQAAGAGLLTGCETAYVGGGTPTLAGTHLVDLVGAIKHACPQVGELTCEANPDSLSDELLMSLPDAGCTRFSIGVQSLHDEELQALGRIHSANQAIERLTAAVETGLDVSCDLMCAIPAQSGGSWQQSLEGVVSTGVNHISAYPLQIEEGTPFDERYAYGELPWHDPEVQAERMQQAQELLEAAGLMRYEVASYARPDKKCRHNLAYWTAVPYFGLGTNASSMLTVEGYERLREVSPQLPEMNEGVRRIRLTCTDTACAIVAAGSLADLHYDIEMLNEREAAAEDLMLAMRMVQGAGPGLLAHARTVMGAACVEEALSSCQQKGLAEQKGSSWVPTTQGWLLGNQLYGRMWDLAE